LGYYYIPTLKHPQNSVVQWIQPSCILASTRPEYQCSSTREGNLLKQTTVEFEGKNVKAEEIEFEVEKEPWSVYRLADGTVVRMKQALVSIVRLVDVYKPDGEPIYTFKASGIVHTDVPELLKKKQKTQ